MSVTLSDQQTTPAADPAPGELTPRRVASGWWWLMVLGGLAGIVSGVIQIHDRIAWAAGTKGADAMCEISAVVSCSSVYSHWQSAALGVPNALIGMPVFAIIASAGLAGLLGSRLSRGYLAAIWGLNVFMAAFITWYMQQSAYAIGTLCIYCTACMAAIIVTGIGATRAADGGLALGTGRAGRTLRSFVHGGTDLIVWGGLALVVAMMLFTGLKY